MAGSRDEALLGREPPSAALKQDAFSFLGAFELMFFAASICSVLNSLVGYAKVPLPLLIQARYFLQWVVVAPALYVRSRKNKTAFQPFGPPGQRGILILRGCVYYSFIWLWYATLRLVPIGDAVAVTKCEGIVTGLLSAAIFGEKLTWRWWLCCLGAVTGVVLIAQPPAIFGGEDTATPLGRLLNCLAPVVAASIPILVKFAPDAYWMEVQHSCDFLTSIVFSPAVVLLTGSSPLTLFEPRAMEMVIAIAITGLLAISAFIMAFQRGEAGRLSLVGYVEVPLAYISQVIVFGAPLRLLAVLGSVLVVASATGASTEMRRSKAVDAQATRFERLPSL